MFLRGAGAKYYNKGVSPGRDDRSTLMGARVIIARDCRRA